MYENAGTTSSSAPVTSNLAVDNHKMTKRLVSRVLMILFVPLNNWLIFLETLWMIRYSIVLILTILTMGAGPISPLLVSQPGRLVKSRSWIPAEGHWILIRAILTLQAIEDLDPLIDMRYWIEFEASSGMVIGSMRLAYRYIINMRF